MVGASAAREGPDLIDGVAIGGVDEVGRSLSSGELALGCDRVDGDDAGGAGDARSLHDALTHAAAAHDDDGGAGFDRRGVERGAHTGQHRTPHEGELLAGEVGANGDDR